MIIRRVLISVDDDVLTKFDEHIGIAKRSTAINKLMQNELEHGGGLFV